MEVVGPSESAVAVLRAISQAGFAYASTKTLCEAAAWRIVDDEPELYVRYDMALNSDESRLLSVMCVEGGSPPLAFVPLFYVEEYKSGREPFDLAFGTLSQQLSRSLGPKSRVGEYNYGHRTDWPYSFAGWSLSDATLVLVQDEFDIQFGMDVTLWVLPAGTSIQVPMKIE